MLRSFWAILFWEFTVEMTTQTPRPQNRIFPRFSRGNHDLHWWPMLSMDITCIVNQRHHIHSSPWIGKTPVPTGSACCAYRPCFRCLQALFSVSAGFVFGAYRHCLWCLQTLFLVPTGCVVGAYMRCSRCPQALFSVLTYIRCFRSLQALFSFRCRRALFSISVPMVAVFGAYRLCFRCFQVSVSEVLLSMSTGVVFGVYGRCFWCLQARFSVLTGVVLR